MLKPLEQFLCDTCGGLIEKPEDGWFEWISEYNQETGKRQSFDFRICHHRTKCMTLANHPKVHDNHLNYFVGDKAPIMLARFVKEFTDPKEFEEIFRRFLIPYYEEARLYLREAINDGNIDPNNDVSPYFKESLLHVIKTYSDQE